MKFAKTPVAISNAFLLLFLLALGGWGHATERSAAATNLHIQEGAPFVKVRSQLIKAGWKPIRVHAAGPYEYSGTEKHLVERNFVEVDSCSTDRGSLCILYYAKDGKCLRLDTAGEQVDLMRVTRWDDSCPNEPPKIAEPK